MPDRKLSPALKEPEVYEIRLPDCVRVNLKNGVPVYFTNSGAEPVLQIDWVFKAGNVFENQKGIAAAVAHLIKSGTSKRTSLQINEGFEFYGASFHAGCQSEYAVLTLETLSRHLKNILPLVRELLTDAVFPEHELQIYSQNSIQKLRVNLHRSDFVADREINALLFGNDNPYGSKTDAVDLEKISRRQLQQFYNDYYRGGDCRIFAAGQLPPDFEEIMNSCFGDLSINRKKVFPKFERHGSLIKKNALTADANGVQASIRIARNFPDRKHPDFQKALVLNTVFGGYFGSRLQSNIREDKGYTYGIFSYLAFGLQNTTWAITTEAGREVAEATIREVYHEMNRLIEEEIPAEELKLVRNYLMGRQLSGLDGPFQIMSWWKMLIMNELEKQYFEERIHTIKTVSAGELKEVAEKYLIPQDFYELTVI